MEVIVVSRKQHEVGSVVFNTVFSGDNVKEAENLFIRLVQEEDEEADAEDLSVYLDDGFYDGDYNYIQLEYGTVNFPY